MTFDEFDPIMGELADAFGRRSDDGRSLTYFKHLKGFSVEQMKRAASWCIQNCKTFPTIAELRMAIGTGDAAPGAPNGSCYQHVEYDKTADWVIGNWREYSLPDYTMTQRGVLQYGYGHIWSAVRNWRRRKKQLPQDLADWLKDHPEPIEDIDL